MTSEREPVDIDQNITELEFQAHLDRLVSGDLDEPTRAKLIVFMESEPARWRACGIAFMEAQLWSEVLINQSAEQSRVSDEPSLQPLHVSTPPITASEPRHHRFPVSIVTAATVLIAFASGWMVDRGFQAMISNPIDPKMQVQDVSPVVAKEDASRAQKESQQPVWATQVLTSSSGFPGARIQIPLDPNRVDFEESKIQMSNYEKQLLARQGFVIASERKFITAKLPDGRDVAVPIDRVVAKQVGGEVN